MFEDAFPDTEGLRKLLDRLTSTRDRMEELRAGFSGALHELLRVLAEKHPKRGAAPCERLVPRFLEAYSLGQRYLAHGRDLTRMSELLARLDEMGESVALTPDYKARLTRVRDLHRTLMNDYREMKYAFHEQMVPELTHAGCPPERLLALAQVGQSRPQSAPASTTEPAPPRGASRTPQTTSPGREQPARPAAPITFYVDNRACGLPARVELDGVFLGTVEGGTRRGFRTRSGPHKLCLLHEGSDKACGDPGTLRKGYFHQGWTVQLRCAQTTP